MAVAVTYEFYSQTYGGELSESAFGLSLPAATRHVRWLVGGREPSDDELESYQRAVCAAVDAFAEFGEGQVGGFALGDFKVTHYEDEGTTGEEIATADALKELMVGGTDGFVPSTTSGASVCKLGAGGVLTDPNDDRRTWFWAHFYADGEGVLTASSAPDATRELVASGRICAIGKYVGLGFTPWDGVTGATHRQHLTSASFAADMATFSYLNLNYLFYSCTNLASVNGLGNLSGVRSMRYTFSSCAFTTIDFRGFDPSTLTDLFYTFSGCSRMTTIYADSTWALPTSGITGSQCFYSCGSLVGGNGTVWASSKTAYTYSRIDTASTPGYITAN